MQFTLYYRGELKSNARPAEKHAIRKAFHRQLATLWAQRPLVAYLHLLKPRAEYELSVLHDLHGFTFAPLVSERIAMVAELSIRMLWPQPPGAIITSGGDIDNRLKTLLDALKMPSEITALPPATVSADGESPFFCLLEDDSLISRLSVEADHLLEPVTSKAEVALFVHVRTRLLYPFIDALGLG
jgi:hypothetical protein